MQDDELVRAFESAELPAGQFSHAAHVRVAWHYLKQAPLPEALARFIASLQRFAAAHGVSGKYHETVTVAYVLLIAERLDGARELSWPQFAARNPDLLERHPSALARYYSGALLSSERARRSFVMPESAVTMATF